MEGQHLPGRCLRRPLAPLFVLLRAEPGMDAGLLATARDPRLPRALRREVRHGPEPAAGDGGHAGAARRGIRPLADRDERGRDGRRRRPGFRLRPAQPPGLLANRGCRTLRGTDLPHRPLGPRGRARRQARGGDRHRRYRAAMHTGDRGAGNASHGLSTHCSLRDAEEGPPLQPLGEEALPALPARALGAALLAVARLRDLRLGLQPVSAGCAPWDPHPRAPPRRAGQRSGPEGGAEARSCPGLQAGADLGRRRRVSQKAQCRARHRGRPLARARCDRRRRYGEAGGCDRPLDRLREHPLPGADGDPGEGRGRAQRGLARGGQRLSRHDRGRLPQPLHHVRAEHEPWLGFDHLPAGEPDDLHPRRGAQASEPRRPALGAARGAGLIRSRDPEAALHLRLADRVQQLVPR